MASNRGHIDIGGKVEICKLFRFVARAQVESDVCWLRTRNKEDLDEHLLGHSNTRIFPGGSISETGYSQLRPPMYGSNTSTMPTLYLDDCAILFFTPCALNGLPTGMQEQGQSQCSTFVTVPGPSPIHRC